MIIRPRSTPASMAGRERSKLDSLGYLFEQKGKHAPLNAGLSSPVQNSTKLTIVGDTGRTDNLIKIVRDADALV